MEHEGGVGEQAADALGSLGAVVSKAAAERCVMEQGGEQRRGGRGGGRVSRGGGMLKHEAYQVAGCKEASGWAFPVA